MDEHTNPYDALQEPTETAPAGLLPDHDTRMWAMFCHLSALSGYFTLIGFVVGPLVIWLVKKDDHPFIDDQGKEALNFAISILIYYVVGIIIGFITCFVGFTLLPILHIFHIVMIIVAGVHANGGETYRYPLTLRLIT